jgi:hypothetical protein
MEQKPAASGRLIARIVIGVFGVKQAGKDTVSLMIVQEGLLGVPGFRVRKLALADPLKHVAMHLVGMPHEVAFGDDNDVAERERLRETWTAYGRNGRTWLQWIGTELGRQQIDPALWIDRTVDRIVDDEQGTQVFAISDCRFHNERIQLREKLAARYVRFVTLRVRRDVPVGTHQSEAEVASMSDYLFDAVILNNGSLEDLRGAVRSFLVNLRNIIK